jgi:hypothetical protein
MPFSSSTPVWASFSPVSWLALKPRLSLRFSVRHSLPRVRSLGAVRLDPRTVSRLRRHLVDSAGSKGRSAGRDRGGTGRPAARTTLRRGLCEGTNLPPSIRCCTWLKRVGTGLSIFLSSQSKISPEKGVGAAFHGFRKSERGREGGESLAGCPIEDRYEHGHNRYSSQYTHAAGIARGEARKRANESRSCSRSGIRRLRSARLTEALGADSSVRRGFVLVARLASARVRAEGVGALSVGVAVVWALALVRIYQFSKEKKGRLRRVGRQKAPYRSLERFRAHWRRQDRRRRPGLERTPDPPDRPTASRR